MFNSEQAARIGIGFEPMNVHTLPPELLDEFERLGQPRKFPKNTIVVHEGEPAEAL